MATDYLVTPSLSDRIAAADVIALGSIGRLIGVEPDRTEGVRRVFGVFEVRVEDFLKGDRPPATLVLRVIGEGEDDRARWLASIGEGRRFVLLLTRDVGPGIPEDAFALVHASAFEFDDSGNGRIPVPEEAVDDLTRSVAEFDGTHVSLEGLRRLVDLISQDREEAARQTAELLPEQALTRPYPEVEERPDVAEPSLKPERARVAQAQPAAIRTAREEPAGDTGAQARAETESSPESKT
jgi:hypothetical protein